MGTRARVNIIDGNRTLVSIYRQMDGYPSGLGQEVATFAKRLKIVNGYGLNEKAGTHANGMGCFAAQLIKKLKDGIGSIYIRDTSDNSHGEEYSYDVSQRDGKIWIAVYEGCVTAFGFLGNKPSELKALWAGYAKDYNGNKIENADAA